MAEKVPRKMEPVELEPCPVCGEVHPREDAPAPAKATRRGRPLVAAWASRCRSIERVKGWAGVERLGSLFDLERSGISAAEESRRLAVARKALRAMARARADLYEAVDGLPLGREWMRIVRTALDASRSLPALVAEAARLGRELRRARPAERERRAFEWLARESPSLYTGTFCAYYEIALGWRRPATDEDEWARREDRWTKAIAVAKGLRRSKSTRNLAGSDTHPSRALRSSRT